MIRIAVIGSRDYPDMNKVHSTIAKLATTDVIITGGWWDGRNMKISPTRGVDRIAATAARTRGLTVVLVGADYERYKRQAGFRRNSVIIDMADTVFAFWDGKSRGTKHGIDHAKKTGKGYTIYRPPREGAPSM